MSEGGQGSRGQRRRFWRLWPIPTMPATGSVVILSSAYTAPAGCSCRSSARAPHRPPARVHAGPLERLDHRARSPVHRLQAARGSGTGDSRARWVCQHARGFWGFGYGDTVGCVRLHALVSQCWDRQCKIAFILCPQYPKPKTTPRTGILRGFGDKDSEICPAAGTSHVRTRGAAERYRIRPISGGRVPKTSVAGGFRGQW